MFATGLFFCVLVFPLSSILLLSGTGCIQRLLSVYPFAGCYSYFQYDSELPQAEAQGRTVSGYHRVADCDYHITGDPGNLFRHLSAFDRLLVLLHAIIKIIVFYIKIKDRLPIPFMKVIFLCGDLIIAFFLIVNPGAHEDVISFFLGALFPYLRRKHPA